MPTVIGAEGSLRHALVLMTSSSLLVPLAGLITAPILAHGLGVEGRGLAAAAVAPNSLIVSVATFGLPEALTYFLARHPQLTRRGLVWSGLTGFVLGLICLLVAFASLDFLSGGDVQLSHLIVIGTVLAVPQLLVNLLRGAASGRQMWRAVAIERLLNSGLRIVVLMALYVAGQLTVLNAVYVITGAPLLAALAYVVLLRRPPGGPENLSFEGSVLPALLTLGSRIWIGAVASMLLARIGQILFVPLSNVSELGLYTVAITVSDVPLVVALGIRDALYGVSSRHADAGQVATTSRVTTLVGAVGCLAIGVTLPWWIGLAFGAGFHAALWPCWILLLCAVINIPGFLAAAGLGAWGRPGMRSVGLVLTLAVNLPLFVLVVPTSGAVGGALAGLASSTFSTVFMVLAASRVIGIPARRFFLPEGRDVRFLVGEAGRVAQRLTKRDKHTPASPR